MIIASQNKKSIITKGKLADALFLLMEKETFSDITILQITQYADVSRTAFYRNFETKEDIIHYSVQNKVSEFMKQLEDEPKKILFDEMAFMNLWVKEKKYFQLLHKNNLINIFINEYQQYISQYVRKITGTQDTYYDYLASCMAYGTIAILDVWIQHGCKENKRELLKTIERLQESMTKQEI